MGSLRPQHSDEEEECFAIPAGPGQNQTEFQETRKVLCVSCKPEFVAIIIYSITITFIYSKEPEAQKN